jgi:ADP-heptose:LPS heptosyltransferase
MSLKPSTKSEIHKILLISLTNIGDVILTFPVIDILKKEFPSAKLSVVIGPKAESLLRGNPFLDKIHIFDKRQSFLKSSAWIGELRKERFDLVVDLRNTAIPLLISPKYHTPYFTKKISNMHMREKHLDRLKSIYAFERKATERRALFVSAADEAYADRIIEQEVGSKEKYIVVAPGAADHSKKWPEKKFAYVCDHLKRNYPIKIFLIGNEDDREAAWQVCKFMGSEAINLCGQTNLAQLAHLFKRCFLAIVNDSAPMHLASYLNVPVLALFGPTNPLHYGPWSTKSCFIRKNESCRACADPKASLAHSCMDSINGDDVLNKLRINIQENSIHFE